MGKTSFVPFTFMLGLKAKHVSPHSSFVPEDVPWEIKKPPQAYWAYGG